MSQTRRPSRIEEFGSDERDLEYTGPNNSELISICRAIREKAYLPHVPPLYWDAFLLLTDLVILWAVRGCILPTKEAFDLVFSPAVDPSDRASIHETLQKIPDYAQSGGVKKSVIDAITFLKTPPVKSFGGRVRGLFGGETDPQGQTVMLLKKFINEIAPKANNFRLVQSWGHFLPTLPFVKPGGSTRWTKDLMGYYADRVHWSPDFTAFLISHVQKFLSIPNSSYKPYFVSKKEFWALRLEYDGQSAHSFLIYRGNPLDNSLFYVVVKAQTKFGNSGLKWNNTPLAAGGASKLIKIFGMQLIFRKNAGEDKGDFERDWNLTARRVVTWSRPAGFVEQNTCKKSDQIKAVLINKPIEKLPWEHIVEFETNRERRSFITMTRMWLIAPYKGKMLDNSTILLWTPAQRFTAMISYLDSLKEILKKGIWPIDLKFSNTCEENGRLTAIDYISTGGATHSLFKFRKTSSSHSYTVGNTLIYSDTFANHCLTGLYGSNRARRSAVVQEPCHWFLLIVQFFFELSLQLFLIENGNCTGSWIDLWKDFTGYESQYKTSQIAEMENFKGLPFFDILCLTVKDQKGYLDGTACAITCIDKMHEEFQKIYGRLTESEGVSFPAQEWWEEFKNVFINFSTIEPAYLEGMI